MISQLNSAAIRSAYASNFGEVKEGATPKGAAVISKQGDLSKIEKLREAIESGNYKVDIGALSEKIAKDLLQ
ncbi:MAG: flagellar biosynthesis anti-sigma factor FlgM [Epsilonproteobacteria bacterium]|nr:flagellar biosynthesis anti-sigma factor FlgM [Campylobacterota bacterium]